MKGFFLFINGAVILIVIGLIFSLIQDKGHLLLFFAHNRYTVINYFFYYVTLLGEPHGFIVCGLLLWLISWKKMLTIPVLGAIVIVTSHLLKELFHHERPSLYLDKIGYDGPMNVLGYHMLTGHHSFPAGHSMAAWALFTLMAAHVRKTWVGIVCLILAAAVSLSRVYLMAHFLEDVVAGAMVGIALGYGVFYGYKKISKDKAA